MINHRQITQSLSDSNTRMTWTLWQTGLFIAASCRDYKWWHMDICLICAQKVVLYNLPPPRLRRRATVKTAVAVISRCITSSYISGYYMPEDIFVHSAHISFVIQNILIILSKCKIRSPCKTILPWHQRRPPAPTLREMSIWTYVCG